MLLCSCLFLDRQLHFYFIPCPFKHLTNYDCPGCGFQRAVLALFQGDWVKSLQLYPAAITIIAMLLFMLADARFKFVQGTAIKKWFFIFNAGLILVTYVIKMAVLVTGHF